MGKGLRQTLEYPTIRVARNGTYRCRTPIPLNDGVPAYLIHVIRLDPDPANGPVYKLVAISIRSLSACAQPGGDKVLRRLR